RSGSDACSSLGNFDLAVDGATCSRILTHLPVNQNCTSNLNPRSTKPGVIQAKRRLADYTGQQPGPQAQQTGCPHKGALRRVTVTAQQPAALDNAPYCHTGIFIYNVYVTFIVPILVIYGKKIIRKIA
ncbi:MAG: hypothetical protein AB1697_10545, partial [Pseudomonadota bacterium]